MSKQIAEIKEASNQLARRAKMGQIDEKTLFAVVNDVVNYLAAKEAALTVAQPPAPAATTSASTDNTVSAPSVADVVAPRRRGRKAKGVTVGNQSPATPSLTIGNPIPETSPVEPSKGVDAPPAEKSPSTTPNTRTLPLHIKTGRGVTVGTKSPINTGVTVGSAPTAPAGLVTVGGRPRK